MTIEQQFDNVQKIKIFEIDVQDMYGKTKYLIFDIEAKEGKFFAYHEPMDFFEIALDKLPYVSINIDEDFSLDENLEALYYACTDKISDSVFYNLAE